MPRLKKSNILDVKSHFFLVHIRESFRIWLIGLDRWILLFLRHFNNHHEEITLRKIRQLMRKKLCGKSRRIALTNFAIRIFHKMKDGRGRRLLQNFKVIIHYFSSFEKMMRNCSRISIWLQKWLNTVWNFSCLWKLKIPNLDHK